MFTAGSLILLSLTSGCATGARFRQDAGPIGSSQGLPMEGVEAIRQVEAEIIETDRSLAVKGASAGSAQAGSSVTPPATGAGSRIPIEINENVRKWIQYFSVKDRERFQRFLDRGLVYKPLIQQVLQENGVPTDLYYLAMIESGFTLDAKSHASAVGAWQFIAGTAHRFGLKRNAYVDERLEIIHSTEAAAKYLKNLHTAYQSWYLAMASYNAGEGRILGAIVRGGTRDFWELVERRSLPPETRDYVPKFLAAAIIGKHPERYGFTLAKVESHPSLEPAPVPGGVTLAAIAKETEIPLSVLKQVNPHLLRGMTPPQFQEYPVWVPAGKAASVEKARVALFTTKKIEKRVRIAAVKTRSRTAARTPVKKYYRVKKGDALGEIARRHGLSVRDLKRLNALKASRIRPGQRLVIAAGR